jgi:lysophospholipase L1-like esterase
MDFPAQATLLVARAWSSFNSGQSNATVTEMTADAATTVDAHFSAAADANVCLVMGGAPELVAGSDPSIVYDRLAAYCAARRAAGFKVVLVTLLPRSTPGFEAGRQAYDAILRLKWPEIADGIADVAADPRIGDAGDNLDTTYYASDAVHPNDQGYRVMAEVTAPVLAALGGSWTMRLRTDDGAWSAWRPYSSRAAWNLGTGDGRKLVEAEYVDPARGTVVASDAIVLDTTPPMTTLAGADDHWHRTPVVLTLTASDGPAGSGVSATSTRLDGGPWIDGGQVTISTDGIHSLDYRSVDNVGNIEAARSVQVKVDASPPTTVANPDDDVWHPSPCVVQFTGTDAVGIAFTEYRVDGGDWTRGSRLSLSRDGSHSVDYRSADPAGNLEVTRTVKVKLDSQPPVTSVSGADGIWHDHPLTIVLTAQDAASGVDSVEYDLDGAGWTPGSTLEVTADGSHVILVRSTDAVGNVEPARTFRALIDTVAPTTKVLGPAACRRGSAASLRYSVADARPGSPGASVRIAITNAHSAVVKTLRRSGVRANVAQTLRFRCRLPRGIYAFTVYATDDAGNAQLSAATGRLTVR